MLPQAAHLSLPLPGIPGRAPARLEDDTVVQHCRPSSCRTFLAERQPLLDLQEIAEGGAQQHLGAMKVNLARILRLPKHLRDLSERQVGRVS